MKESPQARDDGLLSHFSLASVKRKLGKPGTGPLQKLPKQVDKSVLSVAAAITTKKGDLWRRSPTEDNGLNLGDCRKSRIFYMDQKC